MPTKPSSLPIWDTNGTNITVADASRKADGWLITAGVPQKPQLEFMNWYMENVYRWLEYLDTVVFKIVISNQTEFDTVFSGSTLTNTQIYLQAGTYLLNNTIPIGSNVIIDSDPETIIERVTTEYFNVSGTAPSFVEKVYFTKNWTFDGQGGVDPVLGGSLSTTNPGIKLDYVKDSVFQCHVTNCKSTSDGAGYRDVASLSYNVVIENVSYCSAPQGGGIEGLGANRDYTTNEPTEQYWNNIKNVSHCEATSATATYGGGGIYSCAYCNIENVSFCTAIEEGGGMKNIERSTIKDVSYCEAKYGAGIGESEECFITNVFKNTPGVDGGGCYNCTQSNISNIHHNKGTATNSGGGCYGCDDSVITNVYSNEITGGNGGGCCNCDDSTISHVYLNETNAYGGGCYNCDNSHIEHVYNNRGSSGGGGVSECDECTFLSIHDNTVTVSGTGGGARNCTGTFLGDWSNNLFLPSTSSVYTNCSGIFFLTYGAAASVFTTYQTGITL